MAFEFPSTITARKEKKQKEIDAKVEKAGKILDKKLKKLLGSKETQLQADSFEKGNERAEARAVKETMQEFKKMARGGRAMYKSGMRVCKLATKGKGRAYGKNS
jgi:hypothetical protein